MERAVALKNIAETLLQTNPSDEWGKALIHLAIYSALGFEDRIVERDNFVSDTETGLCTAMAVA